MSWRRMTFLLAFLLGAGCAEEGSYKLHIIFEIYDTVMAEIPRRRILKQ